MDDERYELYKLVDGNRKETEENDDPDYQQYIQMQQTKRGWTW